MCTENLILKSKTFHMSNSSPLQFHPTAQTCRAQTSRTVNGETWTSRLVIKEPDPRICGNEVPYIWLRNKAYSSLFFLNKNYFPENWVMNIGLASQIHNQIWKHLQFWAFRILLPILYTPVGVCHSAKHDSHCIYWETKYKQMKKKA